MRLYTFLLLTLCFPFTVDADNYSDYQLRRLFDPTISESAAEKKGKVHIYDGLSSAKVDDAYSERRINR